MRTIDRFILLMPGPTKANFRDNDTGLPQQAYKTCPLCQGPQMLYMTEYRFMGGKIGTACKADCDLIEVWDELVRFGVVETNLARLRAHLEACFQKEIIPSI